MGCVGVTYMVLEQFGETPFFERVIYVIGNWSD